MVTGSTIPFSLGVRFRLESVTSVVVMVAASTGALPSSARSLVESVVEVAVGAELSSD